MGRSEPTFVIPECSIGIIPGVVKVFSVDFENEQSVRDVARVFKESNLKCWHQPRFRRSEVQADGSTRSFHFLKYSGTRQLAEDIERVRVLFGDQKISVYGISYGTTVMG